MQEAVVGRGGRRRRRATLLAHYLLNQLLLVDGGEGFIAFNAADDIGHDLLEVREDAVLLQVLCDAPAHLERLRLIVLHHQWWPESSPRAARPVGANELGEEYAAPPVAPPPSYSALSLGK